jgi:hypothetical protein
LSIVHRVPACLFDLHLLVPDAHLQDAVAAICAGLPYSVPPNGDDPDQQSFDYQTWNKDRPHAVDLQTATVLLAHADQRRAWERVANS